MKLKSCKTCTTVAQLLQLSLAFCFSLQPMTAYRPGLANQAFVVNMCEKFHNDRLRNDRSLGNGKSDSNKEKNNVRSALRI